MIPLYDIYLSKITLTKDYLESGHAYGNIGYQS